ncbi:MAG: hydroxymethylbilane synthase [Acidobacteriota bacterium]
MKLRLGSRTSRLAVRQSQQVAQRLEDAGSTVEIVEISTRGDEKRDLAFAQIGAPGVFVRELERALEAGVVDLVVHSYKDLPSISPDGLEVAAVPPRVDAADCLLVLPEAIDPQRGADELLPLRVGAVVGTASARRRALLHDLRADLQIAHLRGNVPTRIEKLRRRDYHAVVLAAAGLERLGESAEGLLVRRLDPAVFVPAPSQGALAVQVRAPSNDRDRSIRQRVAALEDAATRRVIEAERHLQALVEGGCQTAFGAWCRIRSDHSLILHAAFEGPEGLRRTTGSGDRPHDLAASLLPKLRPHLGAPSNA